MMRRRWHRSTETRAEIASEAERLFRERGFSATTIGDIARNLGMSPANVFKHFGSKSGLVEFIAARHIERLEAQLDALPPSASAAEDLRQISGTIAIYHIELTREWPGIIEMIAFTVLTPLPLIDDCEQRLVDRFEAVIRRGIADGEFAAREPAAAGRLVLGTLLAVIDPINIQRALQRESIAEVTQSCAAITDFVIGGLRMPIVK